MLTTGQSKTTLNKGTTPQRLHQPKTIPVKSPNIWDGIVFLLGLFTSPKRPIYLNTSIDALRSYSAYIQPNKLDEVLLPSDKVERLFKLCEASFNKPPQIYYELKGYLNDINICILAYPTLVLSKGATSPGIVYDTISETTLKILEKVQGVIL